MEEEIIKRTRVRYWNLLFRPHFFIILNVAGSPLFFNAQFEIIVYNL